ncbi:MAG: sulfite exporter TauE/SafE family protein [Oligoflexia bacterium]|nr:sulfite exporter TauE/SafE family protein [Oligoflexia bacterium]
MSFWIFVGFIVGFALSGTGAGGALISVPLILHYLGTNLHDTSVLSLWVVLVAAVVGVAFQWRKANLPMALSVGLFSILSAAPLGQIKSQLPAWVILVAFLAVGTWSLWSLWIRSSKPSPANRNHSFFRYTIAGVLVGVITTVTGLGGGVLLVPLFLSLWKLPMSEAVPTSLVSIVLASTVSLFFQGEFQNQLFGTSEFGQLFLGVLVGTLIFKYSLRALEEKYQTLLRKQGLTLIILVSMGSYVYRFFN